MNIGTFCSGVGSPEQALKDLGINHSVKFACEIDKYARVTYEANHTTENFYHDLTKLDFNTLPDVDLFIAGFPCQSFSIAGKRGGFDDTRGTIFFYIHEYLRIKKPKYFILENVKGLLSHDSGNSFDVIIKSLSKSVNGNLMLFPDENSINYHVYYKVLNATEYGIPQNRERIFILGFRYDNHSFKFPEKQPLKLKLADLLETDVNDKYFLSDKALQGLLNHKQNQKEKGFGFGANILDTTRSSSTIGTTSGSIQRNLISPTIRSRYYKDGSECLINDKKLNCINPGQSVANRIYNGDVSMCLSSNGGGGGAKTGLYNIQDNVRRLTPRECFRLMGFPDSFDISKVSETQAYKQAGNSIVVSVISALIKEIMVNEEG